VRRVPPHRRQRGLLGVGEEPLVAQQRQRLGARARHLGRREQRRAARELRAMQLPRRLGVELARVGLLAQRQRLRVRAQRGVAVARFEGRRAVLEQVDHGSDVVQRSFRPERAPALVELLPLRLRAQRQPFQQSLQYSAYSQAVLCVLKGVL
jgi:hypothetical protein